MQFSFINLLAQENEYSMERTLWVYGCHLRMHAAKFVVWRHFLSLKLATQISDLLNEKQKKTHEPQGSMGFCIIWSINFIQSRG